MSEVYTTLDGRLGWPPSQAAHDACFQRAHDTSQRAKQMNIDGLWKAIEIVVGRLSSSLPMARRARPLDLAEHRVLLAELERRFPKQPTPDFGGGMRHSYDPWKRFFGY